MCCLVDVYQCSGKTEGQFFAILLTVCGLVDVYQCSGKTEGQFFAILLTGVVWWMCTNVLVKQKGSFSQFY